ncbi:hypothetical protein AB0L64_10120 [Kribbella sp. NPDC051936]|uniref:hypothetical protein n=1 Tax=Kribbella sp. NPDC051936 TaxID=3154946 RepID=UPI003436C9A4
MTTPDRRDVPLDDDRMLNDDDLVTDSELSGRRGLDDNRGLGNDRSLDATRGLDDERGLDAGRGLDDERGLDAGRELDDDRAAAGAPDNRMTATGTAERDDRTTTGDAPLVAEEAVVDYRARWDVVQQGFVDDPRNAVSEADKLVDDVLKHLADGFDRQRQDLEHQWSGGEPSTEDLRSALQRYRAFFQRLLTL